MAEINGLLVGQIEQAARASHQYVEALGNGLDLWIHPNATKNAGALEWQVAGIDLEAVVHLRREFAGWRQHQHARLARAVAVFPVRMTAGEQQFENRKGEPTGLAGACLCGDHQVASLQHGGNGPLLHWCRLGIASSLDGTG